MAEPKEMKEPRLIIASLIDGGLKSVLDDKETCDLLRQELKELGCRPPFQIILFEGIKKLLLLGTDYGGELLRTRLLEYLAANGRVAALLGRIAQLCRGTRDRARLKEALVAELTGARPTPGLPAVDADLDEQVLQQLYMRSRFATVDAELAGIAEALQDVLAGRSGQGIAPYLGWSEGDDSTIADSIRHNSGLHAFIGREDEIELLKGFCGDLSRIGPDHRFSWLLLTGPGGEGKTRLAHHFTTERIGPQWAAGRLSVRDLKAFRHGDWIPRQPTMIVIDYPAQAPDAVHSLMANLARRRSQFDWPVRLLLLERDSAGEWYRTVLPSSSDGALLRRCVHVENGEALLKGRALRPLSLSDTMDLMHRRIDAAGPVPTDWEAIGTALCIMDDRRIDRDAQDVPHPRPLFAAAVAELVIAALREGAAVDMDWALSLRRDAILRTIVERDREQHWRSRSESRTDLLRHELCVAFATLCGGLGRDELRSLPTSILALLPEAGPVSEGALKPELCRAISGFEDGTVAPLEPDLIGELFLLDALAWLDDNAGRDVRQEFCAQAFTLAPAETVATVIRCAMDFPDLVGPLRWLLPADDAGEQAIGAAMGVCVGLAHRTGPAGRELATWADDHARAHPGDVSMALNAAGAISNLLAQLAMDGDVSDREEMLSRLDDLVGRHAGSEPLAEIAGRALTNSLRVEPFEDAVEYRDKVLAQLDALRARYPVSAVLADAEAQATGHEADQSANDPSRLAAMLARLDRLSAQFPADPTVATGVASARLTVTASLVDVPGSVQLQAQLDALAELRRALPGVAEVADKEELAILNSVIAARRQDDEQGVDAALARFADLRAVAPNRPGLALREAEAINGLTNWWRERGATARPGWTSDHFRRLCRDFPGDATIAEQAAIAGHNEALDAADVGDEDAFREARGKVASLSAAYPGDVRLARLLARTASVGILNSIARGRAPIGGIDDLEAVRLRFPLDAEIASNVIDACGVLPEGHAEGTDAFESPLRVVAEYGNTIRSTGALAGSIAGAASNFGILFSKLGRWERFDTVDGWLDAMLAAFPCNARIAEAAARVAITGTSRATAGGDWPRADRLMARALACQRAFPEDDEIAEACAKAGVNLAIQAAEERDWTRIEALIGHFDMLARARPSNSAIALRDAMTSYTVILDALLGGRADLLDPLLERLEGLCGRFPDDVEIALRQMRACTALVTHAATEEDWTTVETVLATCRNAAASRRLHLPTALGIWTTVVGARLRAGRDVAPHLAREFLSIFVQAYNSDDPGMGPVPLGSLAAVKALHRRHPSEVTEHIVESLEDEGLNWSEVPPS